jgi:hypothetical protein
VFVRIHIDCVLCFSVSSCDDADRGVAGLDQRCERVADDSVGGGNCRSVTLGSIDFGR